MNSGQKRRTARSTFPFWKRALDLTLIVATAPLWCPFFGILALFIKAVSPGPVFFRQARIGQGGRCFTCFKFRSMKPGSTTKVHEDYLKHLIGSNTPMTKLDQKGDPRLIPLGRFFRSTGLDELPQLLNILRGEMSLVGPRPCTPSELQIAGDQFTKRLEAPPGLTGLWQVKGKNKTTFRAMIAMDEFYAANMSLRLDLQILLQTFPALLRQIRAARNEGVNSDAGTVQGIDYTRIDPDDGLRVQKEES